MSEKHKQSLEEYELPYDTFYAEIGNNLDFYGSLDEQKQSDQEASEESFMSREAVQQIANDTREFDTQPQVNDPRQGQLDIE